MHASLACCCTQQGVQRLSCPWQPELPAQLQLCDHVVVNLTPQTPQQVPHQVQTNYLFLSCRLPTMTAPRPAASSGLVSAQQSSTWHLRTMPPTEAMRVR